MKPADFAAQKIVELLASAALDFGADELGFGNFLAFQHFEFRSLTLLSQQNPPLGHISSPARPR